MTLTAFVNGIGVLGPGLANWRQTAAVLADPAAYLPAPTVLTTPTLLPSAERRRTGRVVKVALAVALEATTHADTNPALLASVFSSSGGDGDNCHELCQALALPGREISPTRFANSVHNAAAGYWSIATASKLESSVLCAFDASFGAGLLEAFTHVTVDREPVLLVAYDTEYPQPIRAKRPVPDAFGVSLVLAPRRDAKSLARIDLTFDDAAPHALTDPRFETLRNTVPAARCLPLLRQLALGTAGRVVLDYLDTLRLAARVEPCR